MLHDSLRYITTKSQAVEMMSGLIMGNMFAQVELKIPQLGRFLVWAAGMVLLVTFTIKDFLPLLADYQHNNLATQVEVVVFDDSFKSPETVLLVPSRKEENIAKEELMVISRHLFFDSVHNCEPCQKLANISWDVWKEMNMSHYRKHDLNTLYNALSLALVEKLFVSFDNNETINSEWNDPIFYSAINFLIWHAHADYYLQPWNLGANLSLPRHITNKLDALFAWVIRGLCR